jgi:hypothetical protein
MDDCLQPQIYSDRSFYPQLVIDLFAQPQTRANKGQAQHIRQPQETHSIPNHLAQSKKNFDRLSRFYPFRSSPCMSSKNSLPAPSLRRFALFLQTRTDAHKQGRSDLLTDYGTRTRRKPRSVPRLPGSVLPRAATRQDCGPLLQPPPRTTRPKPLSAPCGLALALSS